MGDGEPRGRILLPLLRGFVVRAMYHCGLMRMRTRRGWAPRVRAWPRGPDPLAILTHHRKKGEGGPWGGRRLGLTRTPGAEPMRRVAWLAMGANQSLVLTHRGSPRT